MRRKTAIEVIALTTCGAALTLLSSLVIAIISANGWTTNPVHHAGKERSVALSINKDSDDFRPSEPQPGNEAYVAIRADQEGK